MNSNDKVELSDSAAEDQANDPSDHAERVRVVRGSDRRRLDRAACADAGTLQGRERMAAAREDAAHQREDAAGQREDVAQAREGEAHVREGRAATREREIRSAETLQTATVDQMIRLQQANANLVIATLEARQLAEQVQTAKVELDHLAHHDVLTGLPNRILMYDRLAQAIALT